MEEKISCIEKTGGQASNHIWKIRKAMKTKPNEEGHSIKDPVTGERSTDPEEIKRSHVDYFKSLLTPNEKSLSTKRYTT